MREIGQGAEGGIPVDWFMRVNRLRALSVRRQIAETLGLSKSAVAASSRICLPDVSNDDEFAEHAISMAETAVSNMLGGVTEFSGRQVIERHTADMALVPGTEPPPSYGQRSSDSVETEVQTLYTGVPSRAVFPRGFLWDEGFHMAVGASVDPRIPADVFRAWMSTMDSTGWIPREQILGAEARGAVPAEFRVQRRLVANPPAMLLGARDTARALESPEVHGAVERAWRRSNMLNSLWRRREGAEGVQSIEVSVGGAEDPCPSSPWSKGVAAVVAWDGMEETAGHVLDVLETNQGDGNDHGNDGSADECAYTPGIAQS